jgi:toxin-antitoxin system PIN domain toxin
LPDVNVLLALTLSAHVHHGPARRWYADTGLPALLVCRVTQLGFLRLMTTEQVAGDMTLSNDEAFRLYEDLVNKGNVEFAQQPHALDLLLAEHSRAVKPSPKLWTDAYLSAFCGALGVSLVTFDAALASYTPRSILLRP